MQHYPTMRYSDRDKCFVVTLYDREKKTREYKKIDERLVLDFGHAKHGVERLVRGVKYDLIEASLDEPMPEKPDGYLPVGILRVVVPSLGIVQLIVDFDPLADLLSEVYERFAASPQCQDQIPVVEFHDMKMDIVDWIEREPRFFGKRLVPAPKLKCEDRIAQLSGLNGQSHAVM
jgi:hypothetical protein